jgi:hypothetical protein
MGKYDRKVRKALGGNKVGRYIYIYIYMWMVTNVEWAYSTQEHDEPNRASY